jgi:pimeloyl-ACP methyl ester carboxylesterase
LVHGGLSNCLTDFGDTLIGGSDPLLGKSRGMRAYRFEHDTWLSIGENVDSLVRLIGQKLRGHLLLFIAFSRGGIVATRAAARLWETGAIAGQAGEREIAQGIHRDVLVMTFGSPHRGFATAAVVSLLPRVGYCAQYLLSHSTEALPAPLRQTVFLDSLRRLRRLPPGIADLSPANPEFEQFIHSTAGHRIELRLHAFGGAPSSLPWLPDWCRGFMAHPIPGIGDGAVSLRSAIAYGARRSTLAGCDHNDYFRRADVREAIAGQIDLSTRDSGHKGVR